MKHSVGIKWHNNMLFEANVSGHTIMLDANPESGGENKGASPKKLMLAALAGCTGMDVISILKKMRVDIDDLNINVTSLLTEEHPKHYTSMHIVYEFAGQNLPFDKLKKAVEMSQEKYCGVSFMYKKAMDITFEIKIL